jgi:hypothetical protein
MTEYLRLGGLIEIYFVDVRSPRSRYWQIQFLVRVLSLAHRRPFFSLCLIWVSPVCEKRMRNSKYFFLFL